MTCVYIHIRSYAHRDCNYAHRDCNWTEPMMMTTTSRWCRDDAKRARVRRETKRPDNVFRVVVGLNERILEGSSRVCMCACSVGVRIAIMISQKPWMAGRVWFVCVCVQCVCVYVLYTTLNCRTQSRQVFHVRRNSVNVHRQWPTWA